MPQTKQGPTISSQTVRADHTAADQEVTMVGDGYESYYKQLSEETANLERHARELRQTPGLEHLTEEEAQEQVAFMLRFSSWVFNQYMKEQLTTTIIEADEVES